MVVEPTAENPREIQLINQDGQVLVSSRVIAEDFEKRHADIIRAINNLEAEMQPTQNCVGYFIPTEYKDGKGEMRKEYLLTKDGFSLVVTIVKTWASQELPPKDM